MHLRQGLGQGQPEPGAFVFPRIGVFDLTEGLEDGLQFAGGDADTVVHHRYNDSGLHVPPRFYRNTAAGGGELDGVRQQIEKDLLHAAAIDPDDRKIRVDPDAHVQLGLTGPLAHHAGGRNDQLFGVLVIQIQLALARLDLGDVQNIVDQRQQMVAGEIDLLHVFTIALVAQRPEHFGRHHLREAVDRVQWRPQLVAHVGEECGLCEVGGFGHLLGFLELGFPLFLLDQEPSERVDRPVQLVQFQRGKLRQL